MGPRHVSEVVALQYLRNGDRPVAYVDETYNVDRRHGELYYVLTAVVVQAADRDDLRSGMRKIAGTEFWHTTDQLRTNHGWSTVEKLLDYLAAPEGAEVCVVSHEARIEPTDTTGEPARAACLRRLLEFLASADCPQGPVSLVVLERRRERWQATQDAKVRAIALNDGVIPPGLGLLQVTPSDECLLWLPDLVCSAYRQQVARGDNRLFSRVAHITTIIGQK